MRLFGKIALVYLCLLGLTSPAFSQTTGGGQNTDRSVGQGIPGYLNPRTGSFTPMAKAARESEIEAAATAGDFKVTYNITVKSTIPSGAIVTCTFNVTVLDVGSGLTMSDSMTVTATGSGGSRTCTLDMFYSWPLSTPSSDTAMFSYSVDAVGTSVTRLSTQTLASKKPPPSGTTTMTIASTI